MTTRLITDKR